MHGVFTFDLHAVATLRLLHYYFVVDIILRGSHKTRPG
jgi:hypothetical protein